MYLSDRWARVGPATRSGGCQARPGRQGRSSPTDGPGMPPATRKESQMKSRVGRVVPYGDFPQSYAKRDFEQEIVNFVLKEVPQDQRASLEGQVRDVVRRGWYEFPVYLDEDGWPDNWSLKQRLAFGDAVALEVRESVL